MKNTISVQKIGNAPKTKAKTTTTKRAKKCNIKKSKQSPLHRLSTTQQMREQLKNAGIDTKYISIKKSNGGYSTAYDIVVKSPNIDIDKVKKIVNKHESYERDVATNEILLGGNTYVRTTYDDDIFCDVAKKYKPQADKYIKKLKNLSDYEGIQLKDGVNLYRENNKYILRVDNEKQFENKTIYTTNGLAEKLYQIDTFGKIVS